MIFLISCQITVFYCNDTAAIFHSAADFSAYLFPEVFTYSLGEGFVLGLLTSAIAAIGDLIESSFKRSAEVKDSGSIIPGRGGILDSIDSVIMAAPVYVAILTIFLGV